MLQNYRYTYTHYTIIYTHIHNFHIWFVAFVWSCTCPHIVFYQRPRQPQLAFTERSNSCMKDWNPKTSFLFPDLKNTYFQIWTNIYQYLIMKRDLLPFLKRYQFESEEIQGKKIAPNLILQTLFSTPELLDHVRVSSHLLLLLHITKSSFIIQFIYLFVNFKLLSIYSLHSFCNSSLPKLCPRQMCISHVSHFLPLLDLQFCCHDL